MPSTISGCCSVQHFAALLRNEYDRARPSTQYQNRIPPDVASPRVEALNLR